MNSELAERGRWYGGSSAGIRKAIAAALAAKVARVVIPWTGCAKDLRRR